MTIRYDCTIERVPSRIYDSDLPISVKIPRLWAVAMLDYGGPVGNAALDYLRVLMGQEQLTGMMFLTGFCQGNFKQADLIKLAIGR